MGDFDLKVMYTHTLLNQLKKLIQVRGDLLYFWG